MAERQVTLSGEDRDGDITALCNPSADWSPRQTADAIRDIDDRLHSYFVMVSDRRVNIIVVNGPTGKYLRAGPRSDDEQQSGRSTQLPEGGD